MIDRALNILDNAYESYLMGSINSTKLADLIKTALLSFPFEGGTKNFDIQITSKGNGNEKFFGMRVFPNLEEMENFCDKMVNDSVAKFTDITKRWKHIRNWVLEIDGTCFDRNEINFNHKELTALTLHEIGHVISSDRPLESFYRAYKEVSVRMTNTEKSTQKLMYDIYMIPLTIACMQRRWVNGKNEINTEIVADKTVTELGYGNYLLSALEKIFKKYGSINSTKNSQQQEIDENMKWCQLNISDVMKRKENLKDELYYRALKNKSNYFKAMTIIILDRIGFKLRDRYTGYVVENSIELLSKPDLMQQYTPIIDTLAFANFDKRLHIAIESDQIAMESIFNKRKKIKVQLPSQYEIDNIAIEVDKIVNHYDRVYVLDLIYEVLEKINAFEEAISLDPSLERKWGGKINSMKTELSTLRQAVLAKKTFNTGYKFFVKLPEEASDYEG